jgi:hypothetical protein
MTGALRGRTWQRTVLDWLPFIAILVAYGVLHELATSLEPGAHVQPQLGFDRWLFGGTAPTVRLQREFWHPGDLHWYDYVAWLVYLSHFVVTVVVAVWLWCRDLDGFRRFRTLIVTAAFAGFLTYVAYPAIPPWLASDRHDMVHTVRIVRAMWDHLGVPGVAAAFGANSDYAFPVGALPSLHAAAPFMVLLFFWSRSPRWRPVLVGYAAAMALTLVYTADHFVFDVLLGWAYATVVFVVATWWWRRADAPSRAGETRDPDESSGTAENGMARRFSRR